MSANGAAGDPGPLAGLRIVEMAGIGPTPFAAMVLADMGADVVRVDRPGAVGTGPGGVPNMARGRRSIAIDLKREDGRDVLLACVDTADVLLEGYRPGVMERLGAGPDICLARNPGLVYGRMTGWGQEGPLWNRAGHDINYISIAGVLGSIGGRDQPPAIPLNLVGDFGGGGMLLLCGVLLALVERAGSGRGQVVDAAMVDGASLLMTLIHELASEGSWSEPRGGNVLDGGAPYYAVYETADGRHVAVGALEPQFFAELVEVLELDFDLERQEDRTAWPELRERLATAFRARTRDQWAATFAHSDACVTPVLDRSEAVIHPQAAARGSFVEVDGRLVPAPAPALSRTPGRAGRRSSAPGADSAEVLRDWLGDTVDVDRPLATGAVLQRSEADAEAVEVPVEG